MVTKIWGIVDFGVKICQKNCQSYVWWSLVLKDSANLNVTVYGERYCDMISNCFLPKMQELDFHDKRFPQNGATCHTARVTLDFLRYDLVMSIYLSGRWATSPGSLDPTLQSLWWLISEGYHSRIMLVFTRGVAGSPLGYKVQQRLYSVGHKIKNIEKNR